jgi:hypothetical protein
MFSPDRESIPSNLTRHPRNALLAGQCDVDAAAPNANMQTLPAAVGLDNSDDLTSSGAEVLREMPRDVSTPSRPAR